MAGEDTVGAAFERWRALDSSRRREIGGMNKLNCSVFQSRSLMFTLSLLCILVPTVTIGQAAELDDLSQGLRETYPEWREEDAGIVVAGIATALEENSASLSPEQRQLLIDAGMANLQSVFPPEKKPLPADFPLFAETYRIGVEGFVNRGPLSDQDQAKLDAQLEEIYNYGAGLLAESRASNSESAAAMLETGKADLAASMHDPLSSSLKQPFSDEEMQAIRDGMDEAAEDFATAEAPRGLPAGGGAGLTEVLAETFAGRLLEPMVEVDDARSLPISDEMQDLLQQEADQSNQIVEDRMKSAITDHHDRLRRESRADARELNRLREEQNAVAPSAPSAAREAPQKAVDPSQSLPAPVKESPRSQSPIAGASKPSWAFLALILGAGVVALAVLWGYRRRVGS